jgi:hypothetical protein
MQLFFANEDFCLMHTRAGWETGPISQPLTSAVSFPGINRKSCRWIIPKFPEGVFSPKGANRMDIGDWLFSPNCALNEQIAKQIFDILPERGPIMVIMDRDGHCWSSNSEEFSKLNISESFF